MNTRAPGTICNIAKLNISFWSCYKTQCINPTHRSECQINVMITWMFIEFLSCMCLCSCAQRTLCKAASKHCRTMKLETTYFQLYALQLDVCSHKNLFSRRLANKTQQKKRKEMKKWRREEKSEKPKCGCVTQREVRQGTKRKWNDSRQFLSWAITSNIASHVRSLRIRFYELM